MYTFTLILDQIERVIKSDSTFVFGVFGQRNSNCDHSLHTLHDRSYRTDVGFGSYS